MNWSACEWEKERAGGVRACVCARERMFAVQKQKETLRPLKATTVAPIHLPRTAGNSSVSVATQTSGRLKGARAKETEAALQNSGRLAHAFSITFQLMAIPPVSPSAAHLPAHVRTEDEAWSHGGTGHCGG